MAAFIKWDCAYCFLFYLFFFTDYEWTISRFEWIWIEHMWCIHIPQTLLPTARHRWQKARFSSDERRSEILSLKTNGESMWMRHELCPHFSSKQHKFSCISYHNNMGNGNRIKTETKKQLRSKHVSLQKQTKKSEEPFPGSQQEFSQHSQTTSTFTFRVVL